MNIPTENDRVLATLLICWAFRDGSVDQAQVYHQQELLTESSDETSIIDAMLSRRRCTIILRRNDRVLTHLRWVNNQGCLANVEGYTGDSRWTRQSLEPVLNVLAQLDRIGRVGPHFSVDRA